MSENTEGVTVTRKNIKKPKSPSNKIYPYIWHLKQNFIMANLNTTLNKSNMYKFTNFTNCELVTSRLVKFVNS